MTDSLTDSVPAAPLAPSTVGMGRAKYLRLIVLLLCGHCCGLVAGRRAKPAVNFKSFLANHAVDNATEKSLLRGIEAHYSEEDLRKVKEQLHSSSSSSSSSLLLSSPHRQQPPRSPHVQQGSNGKNNAAHPEDLKYFDRSAFQRVSIGSMYLA